MTSSGRIRAFGTFRSVVMSGSAAAIVFVPARAVAEGKQGDVVQSDTLGMNLVTHTFDTGETTTVKDETVLSEFVGLHYFLVDGIRVGMNLQLSEQLTPTPSSGSDLRTVAFLPQVGWDFWGPMFAALVGTVAPWTSGTSKFDAGFQGVLGVAIPLASHVKLTFAGEVPVNLVVHRTIGFTPLIGVAFRL